MCAAYFAVALVLVTDIKILKITRILVRNQNFEKQKSGIPKYQNRTYFFWNP
jgi:hypothetical protein